MPDRFATLQVIECLNAVESQMTTCFSSPHDILMLRHKVFREYVKIAVGPDFIHTLPTLLILKALITFLWKNPPSSKWLAETLSSWKQYTFLQIVASWVAGTTLLWMWLILQRVLYCCVWSYWSYETEYRQISYQWWQRVWSAYHPSMLQPPMVSAGFISWIISMLLAVIALSYTSLSSWTAKFIQDSLAGLRDSGSALKYSLNFVLGRLTKDEGVKSRVPENRVKVKIEKSPPQKLNQSGGYQVLLSQEIRPISYGTNWVPKPNFAHSETQRKTSNKSTHTVSIMTNIEDLDNLSPRQLRQRRACHTVVPCSSSDKSTES